MAPFHHAHISPRCLEEQGLAWPHIPEAGAPPGTRKQGWRSQLDPIFLLLFCPLACPSAPLPSCPALASSSHTQAGSSSSSPRSVCACCCHRQPQNSILQHFCTVFTHVEGQEWASSPLLWENHRAIRSWKKARQQSTGERNLRTEAAFLWLYLGQQGNTGNQSKSMSRATK